MAGEKFNRRALLKGATLGGGAAVAQLFSVSAAMAEQQSVAARGMPSPRIKSVSVIDVGGGGIMDCTVIKVTTDQAGLYGYGCATISLPGGRSKLVRAVVNDYLAPLVTGREADRVDQIWQLCYMSSYYKNDNAQNAAIGGICDALWDIKGRMAGMPVYQLAGGKQREAAEYYLHTSMGRDPSKDIVDNVQKAFAGSGCKNYLVAFATNDGAVNNLFGQAKFDDGAPAYDRDQASRKTLIAFEAFRKNLPADYGISVDVHSALDPIRAVQYAKDCEQFRMFYCEDVLSAEEAGHYKVIRAACTTPLSIGEVWDNPHEWQPLIEERLIDYIRIHVSHIGGFSAARKVAAQADAYEVKFAWHAGPNSPVGHMTNLTLDLTNSNFGIHEHFAYPQLIQDVFHGHLETRNGYAFVSEKPGWGIEIDEALAARHPITDERPNELRAPDGSILEGTG
jgi:mannonate dehydratase